MSVGHSSIPNCVGSIMLSTSLSLSFSQSPSLSLFNMLIIITLLLFVNFIVPPVILESYVCFFFLQYFQILLDTLYCQIAKYAFFNF